MTSGAKRKALILVGLVMLIIMIVAASLPQFKFQRVELAAAASQNGRTTVAEPIQEEQFVPLTINKLGLMIVSIFFGITVLFLIFKMFKDTDKKDVSESFRLLLVFVVVVSAFAILMMSCPGTSNYTLAKPPANISTPESDVTVPLGSVPPFLLWLVGIGLLVTTVVVGVWVLTSSRQKSIVLVGLEAEKAWQALQTGLDLRDVILKCYRQMSLALKKGQGIERKESMTTHEFETLLEAAGVPYEPIHQLTRLFDAVRYGNWQPNLADKQQALQCLEAIMLYSRKTRGTS